MEEIGSSSSMESKNVRVIGIDLGTTYSRVGFWIRNQLLTQKIPSCIAITDNTEQHIVGDEAFDGVDKNPSNTVLDVKRLTGAKISDNDTQLDILRSSVEVIEDPISKNDEISVVVRSFNQLKRFSAEELLCMILKKLKQIAEKGLGLDNGDVIVKAVISVPSCYNNAQRLATKRAATMDGFEDSRLINETTATALAYGWLKKKKKSVAGDTHLGVEFQNKKAIPLRVSVTPNAFSKECKELFDRCEEVVDQCVQNSKIYQFHEVILVGGSTRIWRIQEMLREFCSDEKGFCEIKNPDIAVVQGASIQAAIWSGEALTNPLLKVWLFVNEHMSQQVLLVLSPSQAEIVKEAIADARAWLKNNELPEVRASELKLVELQATCYLILRERRGPN
ncbi:heat shock 70 kDa protein-like [Papaver somniferum]|uniref:heat shock 70 kDa protein-like n=1 Tax=Papaver somniferum TaxID=3469 RepID=UPI000E6FCE5A|nr:heat shock 70 kDa protein-like [Papaver somniferum]